MSESYGKKAVFPSSHRQHLPVTTQMGWGRCVERALTHRKQIADRLAEPLVKDAGLKSTVSAIENTLALCSRVFYGHAHKMYRFYEVTKRFQRLLVQTGSWCTPRLAVEDGADSTVHPVTLNNTFSRDLFVVLAPLMSSVAGMNSSIRIIDHRCGLPAG